MFRSTPALAQFLESDENTISAIVDGGCDTTVCGSTWRLLATTSRKVDIQGFSANLQKKNIPIVSAVSVAVINGERFLLRVNEALYLPTNANTLLSVIQLREFGVIVDDCAKRHQGQQLLQVDDVVLPLTLKNGLMVLTLETPNDDDLQSLSEILLTSDTPVSYTHLTLPTIA